MPAWRAIQAEFRSNLPLILAGYDPAGYLWCYGDMMRRRFGVSLPVGDLARSRDGEP